MANRFLPGYPKKVGSNINEAIFDHDGPASYSNVVVNAGTGDVIQNSDLGMPLEGISSVDCEYLSSDGINYVIPELIPYLSAAVQNGSSVQQFRLRWFVLATNAEVANTINLSGKSVRIKVRFE
jgi:hypothetical protein